MHGNRIMYIVVLAAMVSLAATGLAPAAADDAWLSETGETFLVGQPGYLTQRKQKTGARQKLSQGRKDGTNREPSRGRKDGTSQEPSRGRKDGTSQELSRRRKSGTSQKLSRGRKDGTRQELRRIRKI